MPLFNIHEAKTHFSRLVEDAAAGKEVFIAKAGSQSPESCQYRMMRPFSVRAAHQGCLLAR